MSEINKLKVKIGNIEFEAEGASEIVAAQYEAFLSIVKEHGELLNTTEKHSFSESNENRVKHKNKKENEHKPLERIFKKDGDVISLLGLPKSKKPVADALLMLLFGYQKLSDDFHVTGVRLNQSLKQSGIRVNRVDTAIKPYASLILEAGSRRGKRYGLNNQGVIKAQELIEGLHKGDVMED